MSVADVVRHDLLVVRRSLLLKTVVAAGVGAPIAGVLLAFGLTDEVTFRYLVLSMWLVVGGVVPLVGALAAAPAVAAARESGRLRFLLSTPTDRGAAVAGLLCSRLAAVVGSLAVGLVCGTVVLGALPLPVEPGRLVGFALFTLLVAATYVSLGLAVSTAVASGTRAVGATVGLFVVTLFWPQVASILHGVLADLGVAASPTAFQFLGRLSPFGAYSQAVSDPGAIYGVEVTTPLLGSGAMAAVLVVWATVPLALAVRRFTAVDL